MKLIKGTVLLPLLFGVSAAVQAQFFSTVTSSNTAMITGYYGTGVGWVAIPSAVFSRPVTVIADNAFSGKANITGVTLPNTLTTIGNQAFNGCTLMASINIPSSVTTIGYQAFYYCISLTNISIPSGAASIGYGLFDECFHLSSITVDPANPIWSSVNDVLYNKSQTTLLLYPPAHVGSSFQIPDGVTTIAGYAFYGCPLTNITVPSSVTSVGQGAFELCYYLTGVRFLGNCPTDGGYLFEYDNSGWVYYLPKKTGWGSTFGGRPTVVLLPQLQDISWSPLYVAFNINWVSGQPVVVEACTNLANPNWLPLQTYTLTSDLDFWGDFQGMHLPKRFYRIRLP